MPKNEITIDRHQLGRLKASYTIAVKQGKKEFAFQGQAILTAYAKYLIQYLEGLFQSN